MSSSSTLRCISPGDGSLVAERELADQPAITAVFARAARAQRGWAATPLSARVKLLGQFVDEFVAQKVPIGEEISRQMGRPVASCGGEVAGLEERARYMLDIADSSLADIVPAEKPGLRRFVRREPLGVVFTVAPWNYPYLTAVNSVIPALAAGNAVVLKHSAQTPLCAERFAACFAAAGLPEGVFQVLHTSHQGVEQAIADPHCNFVAFTGSVPGGQAVQAAASGRFIATGLELGGKDPAYVRADVNLDHALESLVDGVYFNSGQSCCGIERIYVARPVYSAFVDGFVALAGQYRLGDPLDPHTSLGPMVRISAADLVREQIGAAVNGGAKALLDPRQFPADRAGSPYLAPQVLVDVDHSMSVMSEESFGPVVGIMPVDTDEQAVALMNDSRYGLTASLWTSDERSALALGQQLQTGTVFMNRCDYLDPGLAWVGVKDSGRGCTLSSVGFEHLTRPKSFHFRSIKAFCKE